VRDLDRDDRPGVARLTEPRYLTAPELDKLLGKFTPTFKPCIRAFFVAPTGDSGQAMARIGAG
jgi:hypothetical protein